MIEKYKEDILKEIYQNTNITVKNLDNIYIDYQCSFGNYLILINKIIFYCEILKCKKIFLNSNNNIFIRNTIYDDKFNLTIELANFSIPIKREELSSTYFHHPYYRFFKIKPENKFYVFRNEILKNLPQVNVSPDDLYIHIRGGDIFNFGGTLSSYSQPPLCFYKEIIINNDFRNIYIISMDDKNPVINHLLSLYSNVIFYRNPLEYDIAKLVYCYNLVGSLSSFSTGIIKLNNNLKNVWEYDFYRLREKIMHLHHSIYNYKRNYTIFLMRPSRNYVKEMYLWKNDKRQLKLMIKDKCYKKFKVIIPNNA